MTDPHPLTRRSVLAGLAPLVLLASPPSTSREADHTPAERGQAETLQTTTRRRRCVGVL